MRMRDVKIEKQVSTAYKEPQETRKINFRGDGRVNACGNAAQNVYSTLKANAIKFIEVCEDDDENDHYDDPTAFVATASQEAGIIGFNLHYLGVEIK